MWHRYCVSIAAVVPVQTSEHCVPGGALVCHTVPVGLCKCFDIPSWLSCVWVPSFLQSFLTIKLYLLPFSRCCFALSYFPCMPFCAEVFLLSFPSATCQSQWSWWLTRLRMQGRAVRQRGCQFRTSPLDQNTAVLFVSILKLSVPAAWSPLNNDHIPCADMVGSLGNYWSQSWDNIKHLLLNIYLYPAVPLWFPNCGVPTHPEFAPLWGSIMNTLKRWTFLYLDWASQYSHSSTQAEWIQGKRARILLKALLRGK